MRAATREITRKSAANTVKANDYDALLREIRRQNPGR
jgi:hypothetical protein